MPGTWHIPLTARGHSGAVTQNFLWQDGPVYVMDNHRAAWWCWLRHLTKGAPFDLFHIDRHTDTLASNLDIWLNALPGDPRGMSLQEYLGSKVRLGGFDTATIRWDNYLSLFLAQEGEYAGAIYFATHRDGDNPDVEKGQLQEVEVWQLPENFEYWLEQGNNWIVNIDLDYFFCEFPDGTHRRFLGEAYVAALCGALRTHLASRKIAVLTICLTPDEGGFSGGWASAESLCAEFCQQLGIDFALAPTNPLIEGTKP